MKYMFASDVHGSAYYCRLMLEKYKEEQAERLVLLGDLLYHGPRNDLPKEYAPKEVIKMLNGMKNDIYAVRGNCEAEVDQMVLEFPILADYGVICLENRVIYATHGHVYNEQKLPPLYPFAIVFCLLFIGWLHCRICRENLVYPPPVRRRFAAPPAGSASVRRRAQTPSAVSC